MNNKYLNLLGTSRIQYLHSQRWSILLLIVVISGFMLVAFSTLSGKIKTELDNKLSIKENTPLFYSELERVQLTKDAFSSERISTENATLDVVKRGWEVYLYSKSSRIINWSWTGTVQLNLLTPGTQVCYREVTAWPGLPPRF